MINLETCYGFNFEFECWMQYFLHFRLKDLKTCFFLDFFVLSFLIFFIFFHIILKLCNIRIKF